MPQLRCCPHWARRLPTTSISSSRPIGLACRSDALTSVHGTVFGLLPLALGLGAGADLRAPLAVAVIGGLISATLLTLIVVPVMYASFESLRGVASSEAPS